MRFEIENVLAIRKADIEVGPVDGGKSPGITLIVGENASGKTVLRNAMAAALTGTYALYGATKETAAALVADGAEHGIARVYYAEDEGVQVTWPNCRVKLKGSPETADKVTVGWDTPLELKGKAWIDWLSRVAGVDADNVTDDLAAAIKEALNPAVKAWGDDLVKKIRGLGWDGAAAEYSGKAQAERGLWAKLTGQRWGSNLLNLDKVHWSHVELDPKLNVREAEIELAKLKDDVAIARARANMISPEERGKLRKEAERLPELQAEHTRHMAEAEEISHEISGASKVYEFECANCGFHHILKMVGDRIVPEAEHAVVDVDALRERKASILAEAHQIMEEMGKASIARHKLDQDEAAKNSKPTDEIARLLARIDRLEPKVAAAKTTAEAKALAESAIALQRVAEFLAPGGYRRQMLIEALGNPAIKGSLMSRICELTAKMFGERHMAWIDVDQEDMPCMLGKADAEVEGLYWRDLSWAGDASSSMLRVRAALQMLHAERVGAPCVLVDMLDTLQGEPQRAFFQAIIRHVKVPVVLFATPAGGVTPEVDKLAAAKLGRTYRIDADGVVRGVNQRS